MLRLVIKSNAPDKSRAEAGNRGVNRVVLGREWAFRQICEVVSSALEFNKSGGITFDRSSMNFVFGNTSLNRFHKGIEKLSRFRRPVKIIFRANEGSGGNKQYVEMHGAKTGSKLEPAETLRDVLTRSWKTAP